MEKIEKIRKFFFELSKSSKIFKKIFKIETKNKNKKELKTTYLKIFEKSCKILKNFKKLEKLDKNFFFK